MKAGGNTDASFVVFPISELTLFNCFNWRLSMKINYRKLSEYQKSNSNLKKQQQALQETHLFLGYV